VAATFKDDGYSGFKEISRDGFAELIAAIQAGQVDVMIVRDIDPADPQPAGLERVPESMRAVGSAAERLHWRETPAVPSQDFRQFTLR